MGVVIVESVGWVSMLWCCRVMYRKGKIGEQKMELLTVEGQPYLIRAFDQISSIYNRTTSLHFSILLSLPTLPTKYSELNTVTTLNEQTENPTS